MSSTVYAPATATRQITDAGFLVSSTFVLEPQTTPFTQPSSCASKNIYCAVESMRAAGDCVEIDSMDTENFSILRSDCYPPEYTNIFLYRGQSDDVTTAAYPGDACISGWTTACSGTVVGSDSSAHAQTYCCPPGGYTCDTQWTRRQCVSLLSTATEVWVTNTTGTYGFETTQFAGLAADEEPIWIWRRAFPISGIKVAAAAATTTASGLAATGSGVAAATVAGASSTSGGSGSGSGSSSDTEGGPLSMGELAGMILGGAALIALLAALGFWLFRRRAAGTANRQDDGERTARSGPPSEFEQQSKSTEYAEYYKAELPVYGTEVSELPASYGPGYVPPPVEMDGQNKHQTRYEMP